MKPDTRLIGYAAAAVLLTVAMPALAGSSTDGGGALTLNEDLDFQINYPSFLRFRVGSAGASINVLDFDVPATGLGLGATVSATGGDAGVSSVTVSVVANTGSVTITATNNSGGAGLGTGVPADGFIDYNQIQTTSTDNANLPAPTLSNVGGTSAIVATTMGPVTIRSGAWTYSYANTSIPNPGIYGTSANGGRVTYTASTP